jgi:ribosomal protein S18 acetylase RimI-like enzyme
MTEHTYQIRVMRDEDYQEVHKLWKQISGFAMRTLDDSEEGVLRFIHRNPTTSIVAEMEGEIVGTILAGHDGRQASFYHVCVRKDRRNMGIGTAMVTAAMRALNEEHVNKITLVAFRKNEVGNRFWQHVGWKIREDVNVYEFVLNDKNISTFNEEVSL